MSTCACATRPTRRADRAHPSAAPAAGRQDRDDPRGRHPGLDGGAPRGADPGADPEGRGGAADRDRGLADPVEATSDASLSDALFSDDGSSDAPAPPKNLRALRALYTPFGLSGLRAVAVPGVPGDEVLAAFAGDDTDLSDEEIAELQRRTKVVKELPTVTVAGSASVNVRPR